MAAARMCAVESSRTYKWASRTHVGTAEGGLHMVAGDYQLMTAIRNCLPTLSGNLIGDGALCVK